MLTSRTMSQPSILGPVTVMILIGAFLIHTWLEGDSCPVWKYPNKDLSLNDTLPIPYTALSSWSDSLRTLVLLPGSGSEPVKCELESTRLSADPSYEALSYQWGDSTRLKAVLINNVTVAITSNLAAALSSLRHKKQPKRLWIDAVCINQQDNDEKARQVANMASIYQRAQSVIVYLGDHKPYNRLHKDKLTDRVQQAKAQALERFLKKSAKEEEERQQRLESGELQKPEEDQQKAMQNEIDAAEHHAKMNEMAMDYFLRNIIHEQYWSRGWIIQEIIMAPNNLIVCHGSDMTTWSDFMQWVHRYHQLYPGDYAIRPIIRLNELRESRSRTGSVLTLASLLETFKDSFTSYHHSGVYHDKIYSLLGLAHDSSNGTFPIDYKKTATQLYKDCINHFWNNSSMTLKQRSIELPYFSTLVRRVLVRQPTLRDFPDQKVRFGLYGNRYELLWQDEPNGHSTGQGRGLTFLRMHAFISGNWDGLSIAKWIAKTERRKPKQTWSWQASQMEDPSMWTSTDHTSGSLGDFHLRGMIVDQIEHFGKPYDGVASWPSESLQFPCQHTRNERKRAFARYVSFTQANTTTNDIKSESAAVRQGSSSALNFVGASGVTGLAPPGALQGDLICRFWNTNTLVLVRTPKRSLSTSWIREAEHKLVGRVFMRDMGSLPNQEISSQLNAEIFGTVNEKTVNIPVSLDELTHLTLDTIFWEGNAEPAL